MSQYDWTIKVVNKKYWVYHCDQFVRQFDNHRLAIKFIRDERRAAGEI